MKKLLLLTVLLTSQLTCLFAGIESATSNEVAIIEHHDNKHTIHITTTSSTDSFFEHWRDIANIIIKQCNEEQKSQVNAMWIIVKKHCKYKMFDTVDPDTEMTVDIEFFDDHRFHAVIKTPHEDYEFEGKTTFPKFENIETNGNFTLTTDTEVFKRSYTVVQRRDDILVGNIYIPINEKL